MRDYVKLRWEKELNTETTEDMWVNAWETSHNSRICNWLAGENVERLALIKPMFFGHNPS